MTRLREWKTYLDEVKEGNVPGAYIINKFGRNAAVPNGGIAPVCIGGVWPTPSALTALEAVSDDTRDTSTGIGARKIKVWGIGANEAEVTEEVIMNGTTPVALAVNTYLRITRIKVIESGTYADQSNSSQRGMISVQVSGAGALWGQVDEAVTDFGVGQSQIGCTTIPAGYYGSLLSKGVTVDSSKSAKVYFFMREGIDVVTAPFTAMQLKEQNDGVQGFLGVDPEAPLLSIPEKTDCGFMALGNGAVCSVSVDFQILVRAI